MRFYGTTKLRPLTVVWMIHSQVVMDHHFQKFIKLCACPYIGILDARNITFFLSRHSDSFPLHGLLPGLFFVIVHLVAEGDLLLLLLAVLHMIRVVMHGGCVLHETGILCLL